MLNVHWIRQPSRMLTNSTALDLLTRRETTGSRKVLNIKWFLWRRIILYLDTVGMHGTFSYILRSQ